MRGTKDRMIAALAFYFFSFRSRAGERRRSGPLDLGPGELRSPRQAHDVLVTTRNGPRGQVVDSGEPELQPGPCVDWTPLRPLDVEYEVQIPVRVGRGVVGATVRLREYARCADLQTGHVQLFIGDPRGSLRRGFEELKVARGDHPPVAEPP